MKNILEGISGRITEAEEWISELEDRMVEITAMEQNKEKRMKRNKDKGFPGGAVVENLPVNAGDTGSSPGLGRSYMPRSNWATITEPARLEPVLRSKRGCDSERPAHRDEEWPPLATTRESPRTETKTQHSHK